MAKQPGLDGRYREHDGATHAKRSNILVRTLRKTYGDDFLAGFRSDAKLGTVLDRMGVDSLSDLVKLHRRR